MEMRQLDLYGHFMVGGVYYDADLEVPFTVTEIRRDPELYQVWIVRADLDYASYGRSQFTFLYEPWAEDDFERLFEPYAVNENTGIVEYGDADA